MADPGKPPLYYRTILVSFAFAMVALAASQLVRANSKGKHTGDLQARTKKLMEELSGNIDVARASLSTEYLRETVPDDKLLPLNQSPESLPIRKSISNSVGTSVNKVFSAAEDESKNPKQK